MGREKGEIKIPLLGEPAPLRPLDLPLNNFIV
jgi:hypothetical protein